MKKVHIKGTKFSTLKVIAPDQHFKARPKASHYTVIDEKGKWANSFLTFKRAKGWALRQ